jgi:hypothetical protein
MSTRAARLAAAAAAPEEARSEPSFDSDSPLPPAPLPSTLPPAPPPSTLPAVLPQPPATASRVVELRVLRRHNGVKIFVSPDAQPAELRAALALSLGSEAFQIRRQPGLVPCALSAGLLLHSSADLVVDAGLRGRPSFVRRHALAIASLISLLTFASTPPPTQVFHLLPLAALATLAAASPTPSMFMSTAAVLFAAYIAANLPPSLVPISLLQLAVPACGGVALTRLLPLLSACGAALLDAARRPLFLAAGLVAVLLLRL